MRWMSQTSRPWAPRSPRPVGSPMTGRCCTTLRRARALGDRLVVGLSTDDFNQNKHKSSLLNYENRRAVLEAIRYVDEVFPESTWEQKADDIRRYGAKLFVMGGDWAGKFDFLREACEVIYLPRTPSISTTEIKSSIDSV